MEIVEAESEKHVQAVDGRKLYYISAEFLMGKLLSNNLINLGLYDDVKKLLQANGKSMAELEETESEPSLGNGGLGRLAACFLDSLATLNLPGDGIGLRYHCGLFRQNFDNNLQNETPDLWLGDDSWGKETEKVIPSIHPLSAMAFLLINQISKRTLHYSYTRMTATKKLLKQYYALP